MKRQTVRDAYKRIQPSQRDKARMLETILSAASDEAAVRKDVKSMKKIRSKPVLIAALIGLMIFLMGCAVVLLSLQNLKIGEHYFKRGEILDSEGNVVKEFYTVKDVISLQGFAGTPGYLASKEWYEFENSYEIPEDAEIIPLEERLAYAAYGCFTQEAINKADEICDKYDLKLLGHEWIFEDAQITFDLLGIDGICSDGDNADMTLHSSYFYQNGTFEIEGETVLTGEDAPWPYPVLYEFRCSMKDSFDRVYLNIGDIESYDQWESQLEDGTKALFAVSPKKALIIVDKNTFFVTVNILNPSPAGTGRMMNRAALEAIAETFDFSFQPREVDAAAADAKLQELLEKEEAEREAMAVTSVDPSIYDSYAGRIGYILENGNAPEDCYYALRDVNGDGEEELFIGVADSFGSIITVRDGKAYMALSFGSDSGAYLCENDVIAHHDSNADPDGYYFFKLDGYEAKCIDHIDYDVGQGSWYRYQDGNTEYITEEEAHQIIDSYGLVDVKMLPITEFPMN